MNKAQDRVRPTESPGDVFFPKVVNREDLQGHDLSIGKNVLSRGETCDKCQPARFHGLTCP